MTQLTKEQFNELPEAPQRKISAYQRQKYEIEALERRIGELEQDAREMVSVEPVHESLEKSALFPTDQGETNEFEIALNKLLSENYESLIYDGIIILDDLREVAKWGASYQASQDKRDGWIACREEMIGRLETLKYDIEGNQRQKVYNEAINAAQDQIRI